MNRRSKFEQKISILKQLKDKIRVITRIMEACRLNYGDTRYLVKDLLERELICEMPNIKIVWKKRT